MKEIIMFSCLLQVVVTSISSQEIFDAVKNNDLTQVKKLIEKNVSSINEKDDVNNTPLHYAAENGYLTLVELLVLKGRGYQIDK